MASTETSTPKTENGVLTRPLERARASTGEGQDRKLKKKLVTPPRLAAAAVGALLIALLAWTVMSQSGGRRLAVEAERLTISTVERGPFQEYIAITGFVQPIRTIYLDAVLGGQVDERYVREGERVEEGQPLLRLANDQVTLQMLSNEAALQEQMNNLRNTRLALDQNELSLRQQLSELEYRVRSLNRETSRNRDLAQRGAIASREYEDVRDEYEYFRNRLALTQQSYRQDSLARAMQLRQMDQQMQRLQNNLQLLQSSRDNLVVRAPISGLLSAFDAEVGEAKAPGTRLGQIDDLTGWRLRVPIDEHYIARVTPGQRGTASVAGQDVELAVTTVYPEVREGRFEVDMAFVANEPGLRRGQSVRVRLELDQPEDALLLARGAFFTSTGGHWVFALSSDGEAARRPIRIGRQNPQHFEVLEGLEPGDRVITSGYDTFGDAARLILR